MKSAISYIVNEFGCWVWQRSLDSNGYGRKWENGKELKAHRIYYVRYRGPIPQHLEPDHLCRNRACVNPWHLELVSRATNVRRGDAAKLDMKSVRQIRQLHDQETTTKSLSNMFNVKPCTIRSVITRYTWKDDIIVQSEK